MVKNSQRPTSDAESELVLDHRPLGRWAQTIPAHAEIRFLGEATEPRPGLSSGHIPNSLPMPFMNYLDPATEDKPYTSLRSADELREILQKAVGEKAWKALERGDRTAVFTCGSGMTASIGWLANEVLRAQGEGAKKTALYDEVSPDRSAGQRACWL